MQMENMKNMIVLKDLPSNMVEEAFVILKPNMKMDKINVVKGDHKKAEIKTKGTKEYVIKEAELLVSNYISSIEQPKEKSKNRIRKKI